MITATEAAQRLNGCAYGEEGSRELWAEMKTAGLVAVFGASDDLCEFRGAIDDEPTDWPILLTPAGILESLCREAGNDCPYFKPIAAGAARLEPIWNDNSEGPAPCWTYETTIPHVTFDIMEDGEVYCRGIVFALADVPVKAQPAAAPPEPPPGLLMSMAIRFDYNLGCPGYYDQVALVLAGQGTHAQRLDATLATMRQLWEEVVGHGFYRAEKEAEYAGRRGDMKITIDDMTDTGIDRLYTAVIPMLASVEDAELRRDVLRELLPILDEADEGDAFGTEGWQHRAGLE